MNITIPSPERTSLSETAQKAVAEEEGAKLQMFIVTTLLLTRHYGGPQEGGWWFDRSSNEDVRKVWGFQALIQCLEELDKEYPRSKYNRYSVLGDSGDYEFHVGTCMEELPEEQLGTPHYE